MSSVSSISAFTGRDPFPGERAEPVKALKPRPAYVPCLLSPPSARHRAHARVARGECWYPKAYRLEGLCGQCGLAEVDGRINCVKCSLKRNAGERALRAKYRAKFTY